MQDPSLHGAKKHDAIFVAFQTMFDKALQFAPPTHWAGDGVHPCKEGAAFMAHTWLDTVTRARLSHPSLPTQALARRQPGDYSPIPCKLARQV